MAPEWWPSISSSKILAERKNTPLSKKEMGEIDRHVDL
jgi:hypothetical protein